MASSPETAPSIDSPPPPTSSPPSSNAPPPPSGSSPPPSDATPPLSDQAPSPPNATASPPPESSGNSPPAPSRVSSPPPSQNSSPSPSSPPSDDTSPPSPPPPSRSRQTPPGGVPSPPLAPPPLTSGALEPPSDSTSSSSSNDLGTIIGASVGVAIFLIALIFICVKCAKRKKRNALTSQASPSGKHGSNYNYISSQQSNWQNPQSSDHFVKLHQQQGGMMGQPPMFSSDMMSSNYSGARPPPPMPPPSPNLSLGFNKSTFSYEELAAATSGFAQSNLLGQGGFGYVHKGVLPSGKEIAVKSLKSGSGQGEREFQAEVEIISRVHHRHLVSLVGYCIADGQRMLVYDFVPNKTLEYHLHGTGRPIMDWASRMRIAQGAARGLAYLHEDCYPKIIHRDIKTANILLDFNFEAMVADFGLAKLSSDNYTHVSTRVMGTFGYLAPEYASSGKLTEKSDVFSYGVMLLELLTGRRPVDDSISEDSLVDWARPLLTRALADGDYEELVDRFLENHYDSQEMARMVACAAASTRHSAKRRPKMSQIVRALEGDVSLEDLNDVSKTSQNTGYSTSTTSEIYNTRMYNADLEKFRKTALSSQEFGSSEDGTSESDWNPASALNSQEMNPR